MRRDARRLAAGMTLIEVLVALGLSAMLMGGAFALVASQRRSFMAQSAIGRRQQELWVGLEFLQRDLRKGGMGFGFCRASSGGITYAAHAGCFPNGAASAQPLHAVDFTDGGTGGADQVTIRYAEPPGNGAPDTKIKTAPPGSYVGWTAGNVTVEDARPFMQPYGCVCGTNCSLPSATFAVFFAAGATPPVCSLVQVTAAACNTVPNTLTIQPKPVVNCSNIPIATQPYTPAAPSYAAGDSIVNLGKLRTITYWIDTTLANNPRLMRTVDNNDGVAAQVQVIATGVEDLQVVPACDLNNNGLIEPEGVGPAAKATDEWLNNAGADAAAPSCTSYPQVRVSLIGRTPQAAPGFTGAGRPALENRLAGSADNFHRRILATTISTPNLALP